MEAVIFDFDGVIIDSEKIYHEIETGCSANWNRSDRRGTRCYSWGSAQEAWQTLKTSKG